MMLFDQHDAEDLMYEIASFGSDQPILLHCLSASSALCALYQMTATVQPTDIAISYDGIEVTEADLRSRAMAELDRV